MFPLYRIQLNRMQKEDVIMADRKTAKEEKYANEILMFSNSRDAFGIAEFKLGISANTTDEKTARQSKRTRVTHTNRLRISLPPLSRAGFAGAIGSILSSVYARQPADRDTAPLPKGTGQTMSLLF